MIIKRFFKIVLPINDFYLLMINDCKKELFLVITLEVYFQIHKTACKYHHYSVTLKPGDTLLALHNQEVKEGVN